MSVSFSVCLSLEDEKDEGQNVRRACTPNFYSFENSLFVISFVPLTPTAPSPLLPPTPLTLSFLGSPSQAILSTFNQPKLYFISPIFSVITSFLRFSYLFCPQLVRYILFLPYLTLAFLFSASHAYLFFSFFQPALFYFIPSRGGFFPLSEWASRSTQPKKGTRKCRQN